MKRVETYLTRLDKRQKWMVYLSVIGVLAFFIYQLSVPLVEVYEEKQASLELLQTNIASQNVNKIKNEIAVKSKELLSLNHAIEQSQEKITSLTSSLYALRYAFFDEKEFANALDEMLQTSLQRGISISSIRTVALKHEESAKLIKHKKRIAIEGIGDYKEIVYFIHYLEHLNMLFKFETITLESLKEGITFHVVLDVYGIGL